MTKQLMLNLVFGISFLAFADIATYEMLFVNPAVEGAESSADIKLPSNTFELLWRTGGVIFIVYANVRMIAAMRTNSQETDNLHEAWRSQLVSPSTVFFLLSAGLIVVFAILNSHIYPFYNQVKYEGFNIEHEIKWLNGTATSAEIDTHRRLYVPYEFARKCRTNARLIVLVAIVMSTFIACGFLNLQRLEKRAAEKDSTRLTST